MPITPIPPKFLNRRQKNADAMADLLTEHRLWADQESPAVAKALKILAYEMRRAPGFPVAVVLHEEIVKRGMAETPTK